MVSWLGPLWLTIACIPQGAVEVVEVETSGSPSEPRGSLTVFWDFSFGESCADVDVDVIELRLSGPGRAASARQPVPGFPVTEACEATRLSVSSLEPGTYELHVEGVEPQIRFPYEGEAVFEQPDAHRLIEILMVRGF